MTRNAPFSAIPEGVGAEESGGVKMSDIFARTRLTPAQARTVAQRRLDDAECLRKTGDNARANGVFYLSGLVIECLLKAELLEKYPHIVALAAQRTTSDEEQYLRNLVFRSHALDDILNRLPELVAELEADDLREGTARVPKLFIICNTWSVFARYSPRTELMANAAEFLDDVKEFKRWLNRR